ncbi:protein kinase [Bacteroidota bacterium]
MIGTTVSHYKIIEKIGSGGMGEVYKAQDTELKRMVALKFLSSDSILNSETRKRFLQEARIAASLNHPNICIIHEIAEYEDQTFIVTEFIEGVTLKERISSAPLSIHESVRISLQIAEGLQAAHEKGIIHRDIKPANIMITSKGRVKIMDFGLARGFHDLELTKEGSTVGTVIYMSPEQAKGEKVDHRSDIWSLGVILYEMLSGERPFKGEYDQAVMYSILNEKPEPIADIRKDIPVEVEQIITKAITKELGNRYQNISVLLVDLHATEVLTGSTELLSKSFQKQVKSKNRIILYASLIVFIVAIFLLARFFIFKDKVDIIDSIAVLPLENLSGDPEQNYFSDGMTEAIIAELANIKALKVISRTSIMRYKNTDMSLPEIAGELNVKAIVEGSVLRADNKVRITAQLIEAREDRHLWAKNYERDLKDVLSLQRNVAKDIASEIQISLTDQEKTNLSVTQSLNPEAHEAYLRGLYYWNKRTKDDLERSMDFYEKAIELEPAYAEAYASLAQTYIVLGAWGFYPSSEMDSIAKIIANKALEINSQSAEAHTALAAVFEGLELNWEEAEKEYKLAINLSPNYATAHQWYAEYLGVMGRLDEAITEMKKAMGLDPFSLIINSNLGWIYYFAREFDKAIEQGRKTLEINPNFWDVDFYSSLCYLARGMYPEAAKKYGEMLSKIPSSNYKVYLPVQIYNNSGMEGFYKWLIEEMKTETHNFHNPYNLALIYSQLGENDKAFEMLDSLYEQKNYRIRFMNVEPLFDNIRSDPRFAELLKLLNLAP